MSSHEKRLETGYSSVYMTRVKETQSWYLVDFANKIKEKVPFAGDVNKQKVLGGKHRCSESETCAKPHMIFCGKWNLLRRDGSRVLASKSDASKSDASKSDASDVGDTARRG